MADMSCLAEGYVVPADFNQTGLNLNELVVGPTGCGKSMSNAYSRLVHTFESSVVVPISKREIKEKFAKMFIARGYEVIELDFAHPEKCNIGYDPFDFIFSEEDIVQTARNLIGTDQSTGRSGEIDPYWNNSATSVLAAEIGLVRLNAKNRGKKPCFADVVQLHRALKIDTQEGITKTNLDLMFDQMGKNYPGNQACELWKTVKGLASKTASCIFSIVNNALDKIFSDKFIEMTKKDKRVDFKELGKKRIALFIMTSPVNKTYQNLVNVMYADMFRELFNEAERNQNGKLDVPVHIICDDFACGSKICNFDEYISIFRAAGISVTMLLQSESQLTGMYGETAATTIINNCDTYVYMGGMDITTCRHISERMNKPLNNVLSMPLEQVIVFRRGSEPITARRYQILEDPEYCKVMQPVDRFTDRAV